MIPFICSILDKDIVLMDNEELAKVNILCSELVVERV